MISLVFYELLICHIPEAKCKSIANVSHVVFAVLGRVQRVAIESCSFKVNRFHRNQFGLIRLTFLNKTLFHLFSVETGLHVGLVVTWGTITRHQHANAF